MLDAKQIPTTGRKTKFQIRQWGYKDVQSLAKSFPKNAVIIDVGAGLSQFGQAITDVRDDIRWINVDPYYAESDLNARAKPHMTYLAENILSPGSQLKKLTGTADVVYSYWMLPHLSLLNDEQAGVALQNMTELLKEDGHLIIGPVRQLGLGILSPFRYKGTIRISKTEINDGTTDKVISKTKLWWLPRKIQLFSNRHNIHILKRFIGGT